MTSFGFTAGKANVKVGDEPKLAQYLDALAQYYKVQLAPAGPLSGYRTPSQSVSVGGTADDPHTKGQAIDVGGTWILTVPDATLKKFGLVRPMTSWTSPTDGKVHDERNHIQLDPHPSVGFLPGRAPGHQAPIGGDPVQQVDQASQLIAAGLPQKLLDAIWGPISGKAEYAGLFLILVLAGAGLAVFGLSRAAGKPQPEAVS